MTGTIITNSRWYGWNDKINRNIKQNENRCPSGDNNRPKIEKNRVSQYGKNSDEKAEIPSFAW